MTVYAYLRISTDRQDIDNQRHGVTEYARRQQLAPIFFEDTASGRKNWKERGIGELLSIARPDDVLLVSEISRLARSTLQVLEILQTAAAANVAVHVVKNCLIMDGSLHSKITATILGLAAEIEREFISARTTEALARRRALGLPLGRPKGSKAVDKKLDKDAETIRDMLKAGVPKTAIARLLKCSPNTLYDWIAENGFKRYIKNRNPTTEI